jgi:uncharacterized membrane protein
MLKRFEANFCRFCRPIIAVTAIVAASNATYLTHLRFWGSNACPTQSCVVLASRYATIFGQPLSLFGMLAYLTIGTLALLPMLLPSKFPKKVHQKIKKITWLLLFLLTTATLVFSSYLITIMLSEFVFGGQRLGLAGVCPFCLFSAFCAALLFALTLFGGDWDEYGTLFSLGVPIGLLTLIGTMILYAPQDASGSAATIVDSNNQIVFSFATEAGDAEKQLAQHLKDTGAMMYGAYACPHCCAQKRSFGKEAAMTILPYTECAAGGKNAQPVTCQAELENAKKQLGPDIGYPTWKINGKYYVGNQSLKSLSQASSYTGSQDFKHQIALCQQH